jgi:HD superfamily phosphohydrolase
VGHSPFSHASEELFPDQENGEGKYVHEQYSAAIVRGPLRNAIEDHQLNQGYNLAADDIAALLEGSAGQRQGIFWRDLVSGQMDADRMDYLLRDSHHAGVQYGRFDLQRLISTMTAIPGKDGTPRIGIQEGGWHAAEALVIARYFMFTQVYFHKTRVAYDIHIREAMKELLPSGHFPIPAHLGQFLEWDDWRVLGLLASGKGGEHGSRLSKRNHYRMVFQTNEVQTAQDKACLARVRESLGTLLAAEMPAGKSWYKAGKTDIRVDERTSFPIPLSVRSSVVRNLENNDQVLLYCSPENRLEAMKKVKEALNGME